MARVACEREFSSLQREVSVPLPPGSAVFLLCKNVKKIPFANEKNRAAWLEKNEDFPLKGRKFPLT
jgi:hypothetical protein